MIGWDVPRRLSYGIVLAVTAGVLTASAVPGSAQTPGAPAAADLGRPPSGEIPIIFDDRHVYAKPDTLRANRVLAALVRGGVVLVPLRSMFEQMGATVSWDEATHTADVSKLGADVKVTLGKPVVVVNGEERPLDVPPMMYRGAVVVPVRVISEAMGAYVQWVPDRRVVVVRFLGTPVTTPPPSPLPAPTPPSGPPPLTATPPPTPTPSPTPVAKRQYETFIAGDYLISPRIYNEISPGNTGTGTFAAWGAVEFPALGLPWMLEADYREFRYAHNAQQTVGTCAPGSAGSAGCGTVVGNAVYQTGICPSTTDPGCVTVAGYQKVIAFNGLGQAYVPAFTARERDVDARLGVKVFDPRVYLGAGYLSKSYDYLGYPRLSGAGFGVSKLPDLDQPFSLTGGVWYYPRISGNYTFPTSTLLGPLSGTSVPLAYSYWKYRAGATVNLGKSGVFIDLGFDGERATPRDNAPSGTVLNAPYAGLGIHF